MFAKKTFMGKNRKPIKKAKRFAVFQRDNFTCQYCGRKAPESVLEIDHIVPVSKGGDNDIDNLITCCRECNRGKGNDVLSKQGIRWKCIAQMLLRMSICFIIGYFLGNIMTIKIIFREL